ncbi:Nitrogen fixation protein VnfA [Halomonas sp. THAF5a]|uniref:sigma-54 interaction domain-containing protein n=1 Tax=Halomonas sp. THAF5a TaxID=2587844 RepID=UPI0012A7F571|nr:sigma 54-interacting transcriptional regulator [Halomonas sp. THAF5a]QFU01063.1 Nitrogen fixation protein VnfA [Halomonas sp. THAF5a]
MNSMAVSETTILDRLPHGYMQIEGGAVTYMNRALRSVFGDVYSEVSILLSRYPELAFLDEAETGTSLSRWVDIDGVLFNVDVYADEASKVIIFLPDHYLTGIDPDLQELRQSYNDFVEIFQNCFDGIYVADGEGKTLWMNDGFERCYGLSARNFIGRNASELERQGYVRPLITWKVITTRQRTTAMQTTKSGKRVLATGIPLMGKDGKVRKVIINSRDITELFELKERLDSAEKVIERYESELTRLRKEEGKEGDLVWRSDRMQQVVDMVIRVARFDTTILITGESGVGKEVVAGLVHRNSSRRDGPLLEINCGAIPGELLESELFGYEEGAFTGSRKTGKKGLLELADGGSLFLDEIGEMPMDLQVKMLRVLQDHTFTRVGGTKSIHADFRIIAATNRNLADRVKEGLFREDLFYRLSVVPVEVPPLRDRPEDIIGLTFHFLEYFNDKYGLNRRFSPEAMERLVSHGWPGNVRELRNLVERVMVVSTSDQIAADDIPLAQEEPATQVGEVPADLVGSLSADRLKQTVGQFEADILDEAVAHFGSIRKVAAATGISESTIKRKLKHSRS